MWKLICNTIIKPELIERNPIYICLLQLVTNKTLISFVFQSTPDITLQGMYQIKSIISINRYNVWFHQIRKRIKRMFSTITYCSPHFVNCRWVTVFGKLLLLCVIVKLLSTYVSYVRTKVIDTVIGPNFNGVFRSSGQYTAHFCKLTT